jgi:hypothetical protein
MAATQYSANDAWYEDLALSAAAPSAATDGIPLTGLKAVQVIVSANATRTLSGAGNLRVYIYDPTVARWVRVPALDLAVSTSGVRDLAFEAFAVSGERSGARLAVIPDSVTVSAGTDVRVHLLGGR